MKKKTKRWHGVLVILLCWALCAADIMPVGLTAFANEQMPQDEFYSSQEGVDVGEEENDIDKEELDVDKPENTNTSDEEENLREEEQDSEPENSDDDSRSEEENEGDEEDVVGEDEIEEDAGRIYTEGEDETEKEPAEEDIADDEVVQEVGAEEQQAATTADFIAQGTSNDITWSIDSEGKLTVTGTGNFARYDLYNPPWYEHRRFIKSAEVSVTEMTNASRLFFDCNNLTSVDFSGFDTSHVTDMSRMFWSCGRLTDLDLKSFDTGNVINMYGMFENCRSLTSLDISSFDTGNVTNMSYLFYGCESLINLALKNFNTSNVTDMGLIFRDCRSLLSLDLSSFDTSHVTDMSSMFAGCWCLADLNISNFKTSHVTNMSSMFYSCWCLSSLDVSGFETGNVINMSGMFYGCEGLRNLDLSSFETVNVTNMSNMFSECSCLQTLDLRGFDLSKTSNTTEFLSKCNNLSTIYTPKYVQASIELPVRNTSDVWYQYDGTEIMELPKMLNKSTVIMKNKKPDIRLPYIEVVKDKVTYLYSETISTDDMTVTYYNADGVAVEIPQDSYTTNVAEISADLSAPSKKELIVTYKPNAGGKLTAKIELTISLSAEGEIAGGISNKIKWSIDGNGKLTVTGTGDFRHNNGEPPWYEHSSSIQSAEVSVTGMTDASDMFYNCRNLVSVDFSSFDTSLVTDMGNMFANCYSLNSLDVSGFDTSNVTDMGGVFSGCWKLLSLDLSSFKTSNVTNMNNMFCECRSLTSLDVSGFDTGNVTDMSGMFWSCSGLTSLDLSNFDTGNVTDMRAMFAVCNALASLKLGSSFTTVKVTDMGQMFAGCFELVNLDLSNFDTSNVTNMWDMFGACRKLANLKLSDNFITGNVIDMGLMFLECESLTSLNLKGFDTRNVSNMERMFGACNHLTSLDISSFDTGNVTNMVLMFVGCEKLKKLNLSSFDTGNVKDMDGMFWGCSGLTSLNLSNFDTGRVTNMGTMFYDCTGLTSLDLSNFDTGNVTDMRAMFEGCSKLKTVDLQNFDLSKKPNTTWFFSDCQVLSTIYTPKNVYSTVELPTAKTSDVWYQYDGTKITELPKELGRSTVIMKNKKPDIIVPYIEAIKDRTSYLYSETINVDDITVTYYNVQGNAVEITEGYTTNVAEIGADLSTTGKKKLIVAYQSDSGEELTAEIELTISIFEEDEIAGGVSNEIVWAINENGKLTVKGEGDFERIWDMPPWSSKYNYIVSAEISVTGMTNAFSMFSGCTSLTNLDLSGFDTSHVTNMGSMFASCSSLTELDLSSFETGNVTNMGGMFSGCTGLTELDLSNFDTGKVTEASSMFWYCNKLFTIYTPRNLTQDIYLPLGAAYNDKWYQADGTEIAYLPKDLDYSIEIAKNVKPECSVRITVKKTKTDYLCGDIVNMDDLTIVYHDDKGAIRKITEGYTTNSNDIEMSTPGVKELVITYVDLETKTEMNPEGVKLTATVELTVTFLLAEGNVDITLPDSESVLVYNGYPQTPSPEVTVTLPNSGGMQELIAGKDYTITYENNVNAGAEAVIILTGTGIYSGTVRKAFTIARAKITVRVNDVTLLTGNPVPEIFEYEVEGLIDGDEVTGVSYTYANAEGEFVEREEIDTEQAGVYYIIPQGANVGANYEIDDDSGYIRGALTILEDRIVYTVNLDMAGHGRNESITAIKAGSLITEPEKPVAEGYVFIGWYKDSACTKLWNFDADTVQADITLYACWLAQAAQGGICIQEIATQDYTGSAIKPQVIVYAADGETCLKSGKDYTVKYYNNIEADKPEEANAGGTNQKGEEGTDGFTTSIAYVVVTGKGNHRGTVYSNFHISQASISDSDGNAAAGFTFKYTDQIMVDTKKEQKAFGSLKGKKAMKAGTDYSVTLSAVEAYDAEGNVLKGEDTGVWTVTGSSTNKYIPYIPKGYKGTFLMTVAGIGNYTGTLSRTIYVAEKTELIKNVSITLGKEQKTIPYQYGSDGELTLNPGYYDTSKGMYYKVSKGGIISETAENNADHIFTVKAGNKYLVYDKDYSVSYKNNGAVGIAVMTITGIGEYLGSKSVAFKITGTVLDTKNVMVTGIPDNKVIIYNGNAQIWNKEAKLILQRGSNKEGNDSTVELVYGKDYTINYKNNIKKGTASMTFTGKPESGYSGSFTKSFKIAAANISDPEIITVAETGKEGNKQDILIPQKDVSGNISYRLTEAVAYSREGVKPSDRICLTNQRGTILREGVDYTISYVNNTAVTLDTTLKLPTMIIKGKGNYMGSMKVTFTICKAAMENNANLTVSAAAAAFNMGKAETYRYQPKITVKDGKKILKASKDYTVDYKNCSQQEVKAYLDALATAGTSWDEVRSMRPYAVIQAASGSSYTTENEIIVDLYIYGTKLTNGNLYIIVSEEASQVTYIGKQVKPNVTVYYGDTKAVSAAKRNKVTDEELLTASGGTYKLTKLTGKADAAAAGDYTLTYGANVAAGKNKGSVTVTGSGIYGGSVTIKFNIAQRDVYNVL